MLDVADHGCRRRIGKHHLAIRVRDVTLQRGATADRIQAHRHDAGQPGGDQNRGEERGVLQQHADVRRPSGIHAGPQRRCHRSTVGDVLTPGGERVLEVDPAVVDVDERCDERGYGWQLAPVAG